VPGPPTGVSSSHMGMVCAFEGVAADASVKACAGRRTRGQTPTDGPAGLSPLPITCRGRVLSKCRVCRNIDDTRACNVKGSGSEACTHAIGGDSWPITEAFGERRPSEQWLAGQSDEEWRGGRSSERWSAGQLSERWPAGRSSERWRVASCGGH